jgi:hypothetical protein
MVLQATTHEAAWRQVFYAYMQRSFKKKQGNGVKERQRHKSARRQTSYHIGHETVVQAIGNNNIS